MTAPLPNPVSPYSSTFLQRLRATRQRLRSLRTWHPDDLKLRPGDGRPKVSVMLITYNHGRYVAQALESILRQKRDFDIEINVVDDASTDDTHDIVRNYAKRYPEIVNCYFNAKNAGHLRTQLNTIRGFQTLRGEYFALLEGDDYWTDDNKLADQVRFLDGDKRFVACAHWVNKVYEDGRPAEHFLPFKAFGRDTATMYDLVRMAGVYHLSSVVYRNVFGLTPPLALADRYSCEVTINMTYGMFGNFYCMERYMSAYRVHGQGVFSRRSLEELWLFHLHGYRRFAFYLGWRYWGIFAGAVVGFSRYVLSAPRRGEVVNLCWKTKALFWMHLTAAAPFYLYGTAKRVSFVGARKVKVLFFHLTRWGRLPKIEAAKPRWSGYPSQRLKDRLVERLPFLLVLYHRLKRLTRARSN